MRVASIAGSHSTSPLRMIQAPAGLALTPKPPPPLFSLSRRHHRRRSPWRRE